MLQPTHAPRRTDFDILRLCAMLAVVYLHVAAGALREPVGPIWHFANLITALATTAVPLFFMLSGALLLQSSRSTEIAYLFQKRLPRVLVPLLAWSGVVLLRELRRGGWAAVFPKLAGMLGTPVLLPYWFLYALVPIYLLSPLLKTMVDRLKPSHWRYLLILWLGVSLGLPTLRAFLPASVGAVLTENTAFSLNIIGGYLGYFLLGSYLEQLDRIPGRMTLWGTAATSYLVIALGTWRDMDQTGIYNERYKSYFNILVLLLACSLFLLARSYWKGRPAGRVLPILSSLSFAVYLIHPLAIDFFMSHWYHFFGVIDTVLEHGAFYGVVAIFCLTAALLFASVPVLCYLFTGQRFSAACREGNLLALFHRRASGQ